MKKISITILSSTLLLSTQASATDALLIDGKGFHSSVPKTQDTLPMSLPEDMNDNESEEEHSGSKGMQRTYAGIARPGETAEEFFQRMLAYQRYRNRRL